MLATGCTGGQPTRPGQTAPPGVSGQAAPSPEPSEASGPYVALGDSYTSGLAIAPQVGEPAGCARSGVNYPSLVAKAVGLTAAEFADVSCSGATTAHLTQAQQTLDGTNAPQLDALSASTRLVTLGIGGNDVGFVSVLTECAAQGLRKALVGELAAGSAADSPCRAHYTPNGQDVLRGKVEAAGEQLDGVLRLIRQRAPQARVYVVGYPALLPDDGAACTRTLGRGVSVGDLAFLLEKERGLNAMLQERAKAAGAAYVDTFTPSVGHDMCAGEGTRWVEPPLPEAGLAPVHPNAQGEAGMAAAVLRAVRP
ncbi:SGNH/GDSL hydrolase family protein [Kitasatospora sp. McL0602]|uniref:SGNH/GDSL hydrolase family protein n=1 Tax=Kitasatospora sp. McL0602 TaxID=3439530 RepID=UPI003F8B6668